MASPLFRGQAIDARRAAQVGEPLVTGPSASTWTTGVALAVLVAIAIALPTIELPRRSTVRGYLAPEAGVVRVRSPNAGTVARLEIAEGQAVAAGAPIARVVSGRSTPAQEPVAAQNIRDFEALRAELVTQRRLADASLERELAAVVQRQEALERELSGLALQLEAARARTAQAAERLDALRPIVAQGLLPRFQLQQQLDRVEELELERLRIEQQLVERAHQRDALTAERSASGRRNRGRIAELDGALARLALEQRAATLAEAVVLRAPVGGHVLRLAVREGATLQAGQVVATLAPAGSPLRVVLHVPTRDAGLIAPGQDAVLRLDAFPYQRFGVRKARLLRIDGSVLLPGEAESPVAVGEPVFRVLASLDGETVEAYGRRWALRSDLTLEADIVLERTTLAERLLDPLRAMTRRGG